MAIAANKRRPEQHPELVEEARVFQGVEPLDALLDLLFARHEVDRDDDRHQRQYHRTRHQQNRLS